MEYYIKRPNYKFKRIYPPISGATFFENYDNKGYSSVKTILELFNQKLTDWQQSTGYGLSETQRLTRLFYFLKSAVTAERAHKLERSDFFWEEVYRQLKIAVNNKEKLAWNELYLEDFDETEIIEKVIREIFIDIHCAFYNGFVNEENNLSFENRAFRHLEYLENLVQLSSLRLHDQFSLFEPALKLKLQLYEKEEKWNKVISLCQEIIERYGENSFFLKSLVRAKLFKIYKNLSDESTQSNNFNDSQNLEVEISSLESLRQNYPYEITIYQCLAELYLLHSIKLANTSKFSRALLESHKSTIYDPYLKEARENKEILMLRMQELQVHIKKIGNQVAQQFNVILPAEGQKMLSDPYQVFQLMNNFIGSEEERAIQESRHIAHARSIWLDIGLDEPEERWNEKAKQLFESLNHILGTSHQNKNDISVAWREIIENNDMLSSLEDDLIVDFIFTQLKDDTEKNNNANKNLNDIEDYPVLNISPSDTIPSNPPFLFWISSLQDLRIKGQAVAAILLVFFVSYLLVFSPVNTITRDVAYTNIIKAKKANNNYDVILNAEKFLKHMPILGKDSRESEVIEMYDEAFVKWFVNKESMLTNQDHIHIHNYEILVDQ